jgi:hypothetical protein
MGRWVPKGIVTVREVLGRSMNQIIVKFAALVEHVKR